MFKRSYLDFVQSVHINGGTYLYDKKGGKVWVSRQQGTSALVDSNGVIIVDHIMEGYALWACKF